MLNWKKAGIIAGLSLSLIVTGCSQGEEDSQGSQSVSKKMEYTITGLEPGAGQTELNEQAIEEYDSLNGWEQQTSSTGAMLSALEQAINNEEPIMITAWSPHYKFAKWDLKYLKDPKGIFGEEQHAATLVRKGLKEDLPKAYEILDRMQWEVPELEEAMLTAQEEGLEMEELAQKWVKENPEAVDEWTEGIESVNGKPIEIVATPWDTELFTGYIARDVLKQQGYEAELTQVDPAVLFKAISTGDADATLSPWMPTTHGELYKKHEGEFIDLGPAYEGAKIGLAVPAYMDVESLEDLEPAK